MDETAIFLNPKGEKVITLKDVKAAYVVGGNDEKECITVLFGGNAAGMQTPPMVMYSYKNKIPHKIAMNTPPNWGLGISEKGWMTSQSFY